MPDENNAILIRALEASGSEREAKLARAILGEPASVAPAVSAEPTPGQVYAQQQEQQAAAQAAAQLPEGIMTREEMAAHEAAPLPKGWAEQKQQMAQGERYIKSVEHHTLQGDS